MGVPPSGEEGFVTEPYPSPEAVHAAPNSLETMSVEAQEQLLRQVMRRQGTLSIQVATLFVILLFGLPLLNQYAPTLASANIMGFPATWLFLGVLFYPITVLLSIYFVQNSDRIETETANLTFAKSGTELGTELGMKQEGRNG